ncbi:MAG: stage 0 sporulation protein [Candidatus Omnitrophica bacterium]|nr:stage 0 sporulation protein [Candidatus Omnitrophota bacterium]MCE7907025.1 stage 0 sporulation protein [Candidatus Omnitrophica bacterium COP1]MCL4734759.1 stage 0 sporulation protein [Candidatus Omnitrophota bacterium]
MSDLMVQVRLREGQKPRRYVLSEGLEVQQGSWVVVPVEEDEDLGTLVSRPVPISEIWEEIELPRVIGIPGSEEIQKAQTLRQEREPHAIGQAYEKVRHHNLDIKLVSAFYFFRSNKMKIYFSSDNRVDFRELVKDLAHLFHARIELRQIGVRDAAGMVGGFGLCGQELCCSRFLKGFDPITIKMAKDQNLALNPSKISGCCGRLLCCLKYEHQNYVDSQRHYPRMGTAGRQGDRNYKVIGYNIIKESVSLQVENQILEIPLEEFKRSNPDWRNAPRFSQMSGPQGNSGRPEAPGSDLDESLVELEDPSSEDIRSLEEGRSSRPQNRRKHKPPRSEGQ